MGLDSCQKRSWVLRGTFCRNPCALGPSADNDEKLFGGSAFAKEFMFGLEDYNKATWFQNFVASIAGASSSLVVSAPLDVIKTRIQNRNFENPESGFRILSNMAKHEGAGAFFKGLVPKVAKFLSSHKIG